MPAKAHQSASTKRTAFTPKPARPIAGRIHHLHRSLVDQINTGHLTNGIKTCQKILSLFSSGTEVPDEIKIDNNGESITTSKQEIKTNALQTLLFLLLQTDQYDLALETIESASQSDKLDFEKAYCLYRLHEEEKARELVEKLRATEGGSVGLEQESARRLAHLEAQVSYRAGNYAKAEEIYNELLSTSDADEQQDIIANLDATATHLEFQKTGYTNLLRNTPGTQSISALEASAPSFPIASKSAAAQVQASKTSTADVKGKGKAKAAGGKPSKPRHKLPKGAVLGQKFEEDPDRWLPLKQRASYQVLQQGNKDTGKRRKQVPKETTGLGTQGSVDSGVGGGGKGGGKSGKRKGGR